MPISHSLRPTRALLLSVFAGLSMCAARAGAQTILVDLTDGDVIDIDPETATVADLPGPDGHISFSEAMIASNHTPGRQTIGFAIPTSEWTYLDWYYPGRAVIHGMMVYANAYDEVTIDGGTQTAFTGDTNPAGGEVVILRGGGLYIPADHCTILGLDNTVVFFEGSGGIVENCSVMGIQIYGGAGGTGTLVRGNVGGGYVQIDQSSDNVVVGNVLGRVRVLGWFAGGRPAVNNRIGGPLLNDRNCIMGQGTKSSNGIPGGSAIQLFDTSGTIIENNLIGTMPDGLTQGHPYTTMGVVVENENHDTRIQGNRIAGILAVATPPHSPSYEVGAGIQIGGAGSGVNILGNTIGLNILDEPVLGSVVGIATINNSPASMQNVVIGGVAPGDGNEIAGNLRTAVNIANAFSGVRISGNSIHDNGGLGIDLITAAFLEGVTPNDPLDPDAGGNGLQNFPLLTLAQSSATHTSVGGTLNSSRSASFSVEFFASPSCDSTGHGEGQLFLGSTTVVTDASGNAVFSAALPVSAPAGWYVTATAIREPSGSTSEFSACIPVESGGCPADFDGSGFVDTDDYDAFVHAFEEGAPIADFDGSGFVDLEDFTNFVFAFEAGC